MGQADATGAARRFSPRAPVFPPGLRAAGSMVFETGGRGGWRARVKPPGWADPPGGEPLLPGTAFSGRAG